MARAYKGVRIPITMRLPADLHRAAVGQARKYNMSLNEYCVAALRDRIPIDVPDPVGERQNITIYNDDGSTLGRV